MIGREAYHNPWILSDADGVLFADREPPRTRQQVLTAFLPYVERELSRGLRLHQLTRHILGLFHGQPGGRAWRRHLSENAGKTGAGVETIRAATSQEI